MDADSGAHPLVHVAWRALAIACTEKVKSSSQAVTTEQLQLVEDNYRLDQALSLLKRVHTDSILQRKTDDEVCDRLATEGLYLGTQQQVRRWLGVAKDKLRQQLT